MKNIFFLVNSIDDFNFNYLIKKYLFNTTISFGEILPKNLDMYDLVILWNYRKIIPNLSIYENIIIFHSSDLPKGKGFAPIYNCIFNKEEYYIISCIKAADKVDSGNVILKARFKIKHSYTAEFIRKCDDEISIILIKIILKKFENKKLVGKKQVGIETYNKRRKPENNEIFLNNKLIEIFDHLRACESQHPAFCMYNNVKYLIEIKPETQIEFPKDIEINFMDNNDYIKLERLYQ